MRGERTHATRCYLPELERIQEHVAQMDHAGDGRRHGSADAVRWVFAEYDRLMEVERYDTVERGGMMRQIGKLTREIKALRKSVTV